MSVLEPDADGLVTLQLSAGSTVRVPLDDAFTHERFLATLRERFGEHPGDWAFVCPSCGDVATGWDFKAALEEQHSRHTASDVMGQQCIGRTLGALTKGKYTGRGCDWAAGGLFSGPTFVEVPSSHVDGESHWVPSFRIAPTPGANVVN